LNRIAVAANYDKNLITTAQDLYVKLRVTDNFADWFVELRK
jgi:hypothetical protein